MNARGLVEFIKRHAGMIFMVMLFSGVVLHGLTMSYSPVHWVDEVHINEIARGGISDKATDWSMDINQSSGEISQQSWAVFYLGGLCQEMGYQLFGHVGPRIMSLFWLVLLAIILFFYLRKFDIESWLAGVLAIVVYTLPSMVLSSRGARCDAQAFALTFAALYLLRAARRRNVHRELFVFGASSILFCCACFSWVTNVMLSPIVLWEMVNRCIRNKVPVRRVFIWLGFCLFVGVLTLFVLMLPFLQDRQSVFENFRRVVETNTTTQRSVWSSILQFIKAESCFIIIGIVGILISLRRNTLWLAICAVAAASVLTLRNISCARTLYLLPYAILGFVFVYNMAKPLWLRRLCGVIVCVYGGFFFARSVIARNIVDMIKVEGRDYDIVKSELERVIGRDARIYVNTFQLYYVGRELGWRQCWANKRITNPQFWKGIDFIICDRHSLDADSRADELGYVFLSEVSPFKDLRGFNRLTGRLEPLGPYRVYKKAK